MKKIPLRMCLGCREMKPKRELIRAVKSPQDEVSLDFTGRKPGRGAYICPNPECLKRAIKTKALSRAFGLEIPQSIMDELRGQFIENDPQTGNKEQEGRQTP